ncbi:MAG: restriction endonuclease subunit S [Candidatus Methylomirabilia bacterium]
MEGSNKLPWGWRLVKLAEICLINPSKRQIPDLSPETPVTFVPMAAVDEDTGTMTTTETRTLSQVRKGYTYFADGDVIWAKITPCMQNGKAAVARDLTSGLGFGSTEFHVLRPRNEMIPEWVFYYVRRPSFREQATHHFTGSVGQQRVPASFLENYEIPVPPLAEQQRIVRRIDEIKERLTEVERLRERARDEAAALVPTALREVFGGSLRKPQERLGDLLSEPLMNGRSPRSSPEGIAALTLSAVRNGALDFSRIKRVSMTLEAATRWFIRQNDFLVVRGNGSRELVGRGALNEGGDRSVIFPDLLIRVRMTGRILPQFLRWQWDSEPVRLQLLRSARTAAGIWKINQEALLNVKLWVPEPDRQHELVEYLDSLQSKAESVRRLREASQVELEVLLPRILAMAFEGEL